MSGIKGPGLTKDPGYVGLGWGGGGGPAAQGGGLGREMGSRLCGLPGLVGPGA